MNLGQEIHISYCMYIHRQITDIKWWRQKGAKYKSCFLKGI